MDEAMRRAVKRGDEEIIPAGRSDKDLQDEMNERSCKAGLTNRQGESCRGTGKIVTKPSTREYRINYRRIFGHK